jgi:hypothetical protein
VAPADGIRIFIQNKMNHFPSFNPNEPALNQLSSTKLNAVSQGQKSNQIQPGIGYRVTQTPGGTTVSVIKKRSPTVSAATGPFCRVFQDAGAWMLTGGTVTGGEGNVTVPDIDLGDVGSEPADGTFFWLICSGDAVTEDDVLLAGFDLATATVGSGTSLPSNTIPTALAPAGVLHVSIGSWSTGKFIPAGCGNLQISHCPGTLSYARG